jgi:dihydroxy-acid dehydratase
LVEEGDEIVIDIPNRSINVSLSDDELQKRRLRMESKGAQAWKPQPRERKISKALEAYALMATSAAKGAVRDINQIKSS